jgi:hypothetical protein
MNPHGNDDLHDPPPEAVLAAVRGLELRERFGRGGTHVGLARGIRMAAGEPLCYGEIRIVSAWFARHGAQRRSAVRIWGQDDDPSAAWIAWLLWGGDASRAWADAMVGRDAAIGDRMLMDLRRLGLA